MKTELIGIINHVLRGDSLPEIGDWRALCQSAKRHALMGFVYDAIQEMDAPDTVVQAVSRKHMQSLAQQIQQEHYAKVIFDSLIEHKIRFMPLKGYWIRRLYPHEDLRTSCDIDFFYDAQRREEVNALLESIGFVAGVADYNSDSYHLGAVTIEPHYCLTAQSGTIANYYENVWDRLLTDDGVVYRFTDEDFYCFMLLHHAKHFGAGGVGIRGVLDIYIWKTKHPNMNETYIQEEMEKLGLTKFAQAMETLAYIWFAGAPTNEDMELLGDYIYQNGVYGTSKGRAQMESISSKEKGVPSVRKAKGRYFLRRIFPSFYIMKLQYPILNKLPVLLPICWVMRWCKTIFTPKRDHIKRDILASKGITEESMETLARILKITGMDASK